MRILFYFYTFLLFSFQSAISSNFTLITGGSLISMQGKDTISLANILIKDSTIIEVSKKIRTKLPENVRTIDAKGKFIIPGMVDGHIHFFQSGGLYTRPDAIDLRKRVPYKDEELKWIRENIDDLFRRYIACGVTSVVDFGGPYWNFNIRETANKTGAAPRVFTTGPLIASYQPDALTTDDPPIIKVTSIEEALELVRREIEKKPDFIKIWYVVSRKGSMGLEEFYPIAKAIIDFSHAEGYPVIVHATELETARKAVEAGCDILAHMITDKEVDESFLKLCKKKNVVIVPTLWVFSSYEAVFAKKYHLLTKEHLWANPKVIGSLYDMYELSADELGERQKKIQAEDKPVVPNAVALKNTFLMQKYGITIAAGTDAGNIGVVHGPGVFHEYEYMKKAGLTNYEILVDATLHGAKLVGREKQLGSIDAGKYADLVLLNSNPLEDIANTQDIHTVFKNGEMFFPDSLLKRSPQDLAQIQLNAYNARDLDAFLSVYAQDVELYMFPDSLIYKGIDKFREVYSNLFSNSTNLHCKLMNRIVDKNFVIDNEYVTGLSNNRPPRYAVAMYEIADGLIKRVWFLK
ncbi:MAG: amidohydrolase [Ignavibacteria bacterium]|nr:amidohydrolase [Ignavibacteria bacterium]